MANQFQLAEAFTELSLKDKKYNRGLSRVRASLDALQARMNVVARHAKRMLLVVGGIAVLAVRAAAKQQDAEAKLEAVLEATGHAAGFTADELKRLASELQKVTTFGDETTLSALAILATFKEIKGLQFTEAIKQAQNLSVVMGQDLKSSVVQLGKALNDPITGVSALQRVGVSFTESQKEQIKTLVQTGDIMGAQTLILNELATQFGGAATASAKTFGGQIKQLWNNLGDLMEMIGEQLMPHLTALSDWLEEHLPTIREWIKANKEIIATWLKWGVAILAVLVILPRVISIFKLLINRYTILIAKQIVMLALSGPKGWAILAAGAVIATGAILATSAAFGKLAKEAKASWKEAKKVADEQEKAAKEEEKREKERKKREEERKRRATESGPVAFDPKALAAFEKERHGPARRAADPFRERIDRFEPIQRATMTEVTSVFQAMQQRREREAENVQKKQLVHQASMDGNIKRIADQPPRRWE